jgi:tetratricopeptide (TPR) repeat protein
VLAWSARYRFLAGEVEAGLGQAREALALAESLGLNDIRVHALTTVGSAKEYLGDRTGRDDLENAIEIGLASNSPMAAGAMNNLTVFVDTSDMRRVESLFRDGRREAERLGDANLLRFLRGNSVFVLWILGEWDEALRVADEFIAECEQGLPNILEGPTRLLRGCIVVSRGDAETALPDLRRGLELARAGQDDPEVTVPALVRNTWADLRLGRIAEARERFAEALEHLVRHPHSRPWMLAEVAYELQETSVVRGVLRRASPSPGRDAMLAVVDGDFARAAEGYAEASLLLFEAEARLRLAEQLVAAGRRTEAEAEVEKALAFYEPIGATVFVEQCRSVLVEAATG